MAHMITQSLMPNVYVCHHVMCFRVYVHCQHTELWYLHHIGVSPRGN